MAEFTKGLKPPICPCGSAGRDNAVPGGGIDEHVPIDEPCVHADEARVQRRHAGRAATVFDDVVAERVVVVTEASRAGAATPRLVVAAAVDHDHGLPMM